MVMSGATGAVLMLHVVMEELRGKAIGADLKGKSMVRCRHETRRHERTQCQCEQQGADNQLAALPM